jgi:GNAT superfamily N-acetyltransferase
MSLSFKECPDVRLSTEEDISVLMQLMRSAWEEIGEYPISEEKVYSQVMRHYNKQGALIAVIGEVGNPVAYCLSALDSPWYSDDIRLVELSLYVSDGHRKSDYAKQLMSFMKTASKGLDLDLTIGVFSNERTEPKVRLYKRQFKQAGAFFTYRPSQS